MVESVVEAFQRDILDTNICDKFKKGIIMGDFNDANIIVDSNLRKESESATVGVVVSLHRSFCNRKHSGSPQMQ